MIADSNIHGLGLRAVQDIGPDENIITFKGLLLNVPTDASNPFLTAYDVEDGLVIDDRFLGNESSFINHSCRPNAIAVQMDHEIVITSTKSIPNGEEITVDYTNGIEETLGFLCQCPIHPDGHVL